MGFEPMGPNLGSTTLAVWPHKPLVHLSIIVTPVGLEPTAAGVESQCSIPIELWSHILHIIIYN